MKTLLLSLRNNMKEIGYIKYGFHKKTGYITNLNVNENVRGTGVGTELLKMTESNLKHFYKVEEIKLCAWNSTYDNTSNLRFFERNGYKMDGNHTYYEDGFDVYEITGFVKRLQDL